MNRRRLFQIFAAAPFAPWEEILKEFAKPQIFYSIPPIAPLPLLEAAVQAIELEAFSKMIPDLIFQERSLYRRFKNSVLPLETLPRPEFRVPIRKVVLV